MPASIVHATHRLTKIYNDLIGNTNTVVDALSYAAIAADDAGLPMSYEVKGKTSQLL
jgi:hypothetical protein